MENIIIVSRHKDFLKQVNDSLRNAVQVAELDFIEVNEQLKKYIEGKKGMEAQLKNDSEKITVMLCGLQYIDIFNQRMNHLIHIHEQMICTPLAEDFEESVFHLHVFQAMTIELDLLRSITSISNTLSELTDFSNTQKNLGIKEGYFSRTEIIKSNLKQTIQLLVKAGGDTHKLPIPSLNSPQVALLNSLYTMESERVVLNWFLNSMPYGTWENLYQEYERAIYQTENNTELF